MKRKCLSMRVLNSKRIIGILLFLITFPVSTFAGTKIIDYGFEDWAGWSGTGSPADGWIFTQPADTYFYDNRDSTIGTSTTANCGNRTAYEGSYYYHTQYNSTTTDPCLGRIASSINHRMYIGYNGAYPTGTTNDIDFPSASLTSNTETIRFYFRVTDDWSMANDSVDNGGGLKFVRQAIGRKYFSDNNNILIKARFDGEATYPRIGIWDHNYGSNVTELYTPTVDWQDGNWHSLTVKVVHSGIGTHEYTVSIYLDDWDMENAPLGTRVTHTVAADDGDEGFYSVSLNGNWSASYPPNLLGMDFDKFEIWDGVPDSAATPPPATIIPPHINNSITIQ